MSDNRNINSYPGSFSRLLFYGVMSLLSVLWGTVYSNFYQADDISKVGLIFSLLGGLFCCGNAYFWYSRYTDLYNRVSSVGSSDDIESAPLRANDQLEEAEESDSELSASTSRTAEDTESDDDAKNIGKDFTMFDEYKNTQGQTPKTKSGTRTRQQGASQSSSSSGDALAAEVAGGLLQCWLQ